MRLLEGTSATIFMMLASIACRTTSQVAAFTAAPASRHFGSVRVMSTYGTRLMSTTEDVSTTAQAESEEDATAGKPSLNIKFPNAGKTLEDLSPRMRFAPSPTGSLHVGGARTALYNWLVAMRGKSDNMEGSSFVLRVEDTDVARSTRESELSVLADLQWLGLAWDEGPDIEKEFGPYRQSERSPIYKEVADYLLAQGRAYKCFCSKEELDEMKARQEADGEQARYDGIWRDADPALVKQKEDEGVEYTVRFKVPPGARVIIDDAVRGTVAWDAEATVGDFILLRSSGVPVYNFCVAVDDASMGITTVIRAEEHLTNTLRQGLILDALDAPRPRYAHCSLILGEDKQKLSKRHGATSCNQFRLDGFLPDAMVNYLSLLGWNDGSEHEIYTREELIEAFDVDRIVKSPSVFDMTKLRWVNSQHIKMMEMEELVPLVREQFEMLNMIESNDDSEMARDFVLAATTLAKQMMETTQDAVHNAKTVCGYHLPLSFDDLQDEDAKKLIEQGHFYTISKRLIDAFRNNELPLPDVTVDRRLDAFLNFGGQEPTPIVEDNETGGPAYSFPNAYKIFMKTVAKETGVKGRNLFHPVRLALTGEMSGQDVTKQLTLLSMASSEKSPMIKNEQNEVVSLKDRMNQLEAFLETIPEQYRAAQQSKKEQKVNAAVEVEGKQQTQHGGSSSAYGGAENLRSSYEGPPISALDIRVGVIKKVWEHEEADKLFCEEIDVGEDEPRMIASGLKPFFKAEDLQDRKVLVLCNLKARKLVGFASHGMVLCASNDDHTDVRIVCPPADAKIGERVTVPGWAFEGEEGAPFAENKVGKKKVFEKIAPFLKTSEYGVPEFLGTPLMTSAGVCTSPLPGAQVS